MDEKEKQIEEIAKYCCNACEMSWGCDLDDCAEYGKCGYKKCGLAKETAEMIYNAGYRNCKDKVMLTNKEKNAIWYEAWNKSQDQARKETAREIIGKVKETLIINNEENYEFFDYAYTLETIDKVAEQYGVEVDNEKI